MALDDVASSAATAVTVSVWESCIPLALSFWWKKHGNDGECLVRHVNEWWRDQASIMPLSLYSITEKAFRAVTMRFQSLHPCYKCGLTPKACRCCSTVLSVLLD